MSALIKLYEYHAKDCAQAAGRTDNPKHRERLLKLAYERWAQAAARRASTQTRSPNTDAPQRSANPRLKEKGPRPVRTGS